MARRLLLLLALLTLAAVEYRVAVAIDGRKLGLALSAVERLLEGETHWRVYGGRVLTPALLHATAALTGAALPSAFLLCLLLLGALAKLAAWWGLRPLAGDDARATAALLGLSLGTLLLHNGQPAYLWDVADLALGAIAVGLLARGAGPAAWLALIAVAALNREGSVLIGVSAAAAAFAAQPRSPGRAVAFLALTAAGLALAFGLREVVFARATLEVGEGAARAAGGLLHLRLAANGEALVAALASLGSLDGALVLRPLVLLPALLPVALLVAAGRRLWRAAPGPLATALILIAATLFGGELLEGRVWTLLLPFDVALVLAAWQGQGPTQRG